MQATRRFFRLDLAVLGGLTAALAAPLALAQGAFPAKPIQLIVPYPPGGSIDVMSRAVAQRLTEQWGKNIVIDNRAGASGMIGTEIAAKAAPDGYTLLGHTSSYPATAAVRLKLPFDPARAIIPVAMFARAPMLMSGLSQRTPADSIPTAMGFGTFSSV